MTEHTREFYTTLCREREEFVIAEDGWWSYTPSRDYTHDSQWLRHIADELDEMNALVGKQRQERDGPEAVEFFTESSVPF